MLGAATADAFYGLVAGLGLTARLLRPSSPTGRRCGSAAGLFLLVMQGIGMLPAVSRPTPPRVATKTAPLAGAYFSTLMLMLANPFIILSFLAVFAALGLHMAGIGDLKAAWLFAGIFLGSAAWWLIFSLAKSWLRGHQQGGGPARHQSHRGHPRSAASPSGSSSIVLPALALTSPPHCSLNMGPDP